MATARCILAYAATVAAVFICNCTLVISTQVATITCEAAGNHPVTLNAGDSFVLTCQAPFNTPLPPDYHTHACRGAGANCEKPETYAALFGNAADHVWVAPADNTPSPHTWTAPPSGKVKEKTLFSVGCRQGADGPICAVNVTVNSTAKTVASGVLLAMCSIASLVVL